MKIRLLPFVLLLSLVAAFKVQAQTDITIGTGTVGNGTIDYPSPLQDYYEGSRAQYLYRASELMAAGMGPGSISFIKFNATNLNAFSGTIQQYQIKMGGVSTTTLSLTSWETVSTSVFGPVDLVPTLGVNTLTFSTPFFWNGTDNIVVEICNGLPANVTDGIIHYTQNVSTPWTTGLAFNGSHTYRADNVGNLCGTATTTNTGTGTTRPNIVFGWTSAVACAGTPTGGTAITSSANITCAGSSFTLSLTGATLASGITYQWQSAPTLGGTYTNIAGATTSSFTTTQTINSLFYRCVVTCTNGGATANSTSVQVTSVSGPTYATLPYTESFENTWINSCNTRDIPNASWKNTPFSGNTSWRRHDDGVAGAGWASNNGLYTPVFTAGAFSARFHSYDAPGGSTGAFDLYLNCNGGNSTQRLSFDYINTSGNDSLVILFSTNGGTSFTRLDSVRTTAVWKNKTLDFTSTSATTVVRFLAYGDFGVTDFGLDNISIFNLVNCTGTPTAGSISTPITSGCAGSLISFSLAGQTTGNSGITTQWQSAPLSTGPWTDIAGQSGTAYSFNIPTNYTATFYRVLVTCVPSGLTAPTNNVQITVNSPTYATLPFQEQFENAFQSLCNTREVPSNSWRNSPATGNTSWRRDDDGAAANWTTPATGAYLPAGSNTTPHSLRYHSNNATATGYGNFDLYVNCNTAIATKRLAFDYLNTTGTDSLDVLISTDGGTLFTLMRTLKIAPEWTTQNVDFMSTSATTLIRFRANGGGNTDIGVDEVNVFNLSNCAGTPVSGIINSNITTVCLGSVVNFAATGQSFGLAGLSYQWQSSPNNSTWTDIGAATASTYNFTVASGYASTFYRFVVRCSFSSLMAASNSIQIVLPAPTYTTLPFTETFETPWINFCNTRDIPNNSWRTTPFTGNNSWRREDDGTAGAWASDLGAYTPAGSNNSLHSARFHTYNTPNGTSGSLDLYINASAGSATKRLTFDYLNTSGNDSLVVLLSTDNGVTFTRLDSVRLTPTWRNSRPIIFTSTSATTVLRFRGTSDFGVTDIGLDNVKVIPFPNCSGTPVGGTAAASQTTACIGSLITLSLSGHTTDQAGLSYKWQISTDNVNFTDIAGANTETYIYTVPSGFSGSFFRGVTSCSFSAASANSVSVQVTVPAPVYQVLPFTQNFENIWVTNCATRDVPTATGWANIPFTGNNSWRRDNDTLGGGWANILGTPSSTGAVGSSRYARIHTYTSNLVGNLDLYVNCSSGTPNKELGFYYINPSGNDSLRVFISTNGGITFTRTGVLYTRDDDWALKTIAFQSTSATTVIRFAAYGVADFTSDLGIDQVEVKSVDCAQPPNITFTVNSPSPAQSIAVIKWNSQPNALAYEVIVSTDPTIPSFGDITNDTTITYNNLLPVTQYYLFVRTLCFNGGISSFFVTSFITPCPNQSLPYLEGFESITVDNQLPSCMSATTLGTLVQTYTTPQALYNRAPRTGTDYASFRYGTPTTGVNPGSYIFTQPFALTAGVGYDLSTWYRTDGLAGWQSLTLYYGTTQDPSTMVKVDSITNLTATAYTQFLRTFIAPTTGVYYIGIRVVANFAPFWLSVDDIELKVNSALPVSLSSFTGEKRGSLNHLEWITATELNNQGFELQRSKDGINFSGLQFVNSKAIGGNSSQPITYNVDDIKPLQGGNYYRLKQVDKNGRVSFSQIVFIKGDKPTQLLISSIYPNPAASTLNVVIAAPQNDKVQLVITDMIGRIISAATYTIKQGENNIQLNVSGMAKGSYTLKMLCTAGCGESVSKFIKE